MIRFCLLSALLLLVPLNIRAAEGQSVLQPKTGESIIFLGGTLIERAQQYGFWESMITSQLSDRQVIFRNLGWSGDTVSAESRGIFDPPTKSYKRMIEAKGYQRMIEQIKKIQPRYVLVSYGGNESFNGPDGVALFLNQMEVLLKHVKGEKTDVILITPIKFEKLAPPLPDPHKANRNREIYVNGLKKFGAVHDLPVLDLFTTLITDGSTVPESPKTYNGIHLSPEGYYLSARILKKQIFPKSVNPELVLNSEGVVLSQAGLTVSQVKKDKNRFSFRVKRETLPLINAKNELAGETLVNLSLQGLEEGTYTLSIDGELVIKADSKDWETGLEIRSEADLKRARELNATILKKNELYFHSWRPQNITYLFGFRKHEQGQNAKEVDEMIKLVKKEEEKINSLRDQRTSTWAFTRN